jgi:hypothetical protein
MNLGGVLSHAEMATFSNNIIKKEEKERNKRIKKGLQMFTMNRSQSIPRGTPSTVSTQSALLQVAGAGDSGQLAKKIRMMYTLPVAKREKL